MSNIQVRTNLYVDVRHDTKSPYLRAFWQLRIEVKGECIMHFPVGTIPAGLTVNDPIQDRLKQDIFGFGIWQCPIDI